MGFISVLACWMMVGCLLAGCASVENPLPRDASQAASSGVLPIYYALPPGFAWRSVGDINVSAEGDNAHIDILVADAETHARHLGADAIIVREIRTDARTQLQTVWRSCRSTGLSRGISGTCPYTENVLTIVAQMDATAVVRDQDAAASQGAWRAPPPLGAAGSPLLPHTSSTSTLRDPDDAIPQP